MPLSQRKKLANRHLGLGQSKEKSIKIKLKVVPDTNTGY